MDNLKITLLFCSPLGLLPHTFDPHTLKLATTSPATSGVL